VTDDEVKINRQPVPQSNPDPARRETQPSRDAGCRIASGKADDTV